MRKPQPLPDPRAAGAPDRCRLDLTDPGHTSGRAPDVHQDVPAWLSDSLGAVYHPCNPITHLRPPSSENNLLTPPPRNTRIVGDTEKPPARHAPAGDTSWVPGMRVALFPVTRSADGP